MEIVSQKKYAGKARQAAERIIQAFEQGEVPTALAQVYIRRNDDVPCRQWSWCNQMLVALYGESDARGFRQWQEVDRYVKAGEKAFYILAPMTRKRKERDPDTGEEVERVMLYGFRAVPVFGKSQTAGKPLPDDVAEENWITSLPLVEVAQSWGITVKTYSGEGARCHGHYSHRGAIALGVENLATWAHELVHAADDRLGNLTERGQHWRSETVAELGGATLLECLGHHVEADLGGAYRYVRKYAEENDKDVATACMQMLKRTAEAVASILETAEQAAKAAA